MARSSSACCHGLTESSGPPHSAQRSRAAVTCGAGLALKA
jgi:hypothetical protein